MATDALPYLDQRTKALAVVYLTRRKDLVVTKTGFDSGIDLLAFIARPGEPTKQRFGVMVKGTTEAIPDEDDATARLNSMNIKQEGCEHAIPVCVFLFSMQNDQGYYDWQAEPVLKDGKIQLSLKSSFHAHKLTTQALNNIVDTVNRWSDASSRPCCTQ